MVATFILPSKVAEILAKMFYLNILLSFILGSVCLKETLQDAAEVIQCPSFKFQLGQWGNSEALTNSAIGNSKILEAIIGTTFQWNETLRVLWVNEDLIIHRSF